MQFLKNQSISPFPRLGWAVSGLRGEEVWSNEPGNRRRLQRNLIYDQRLSPGVRLMYMLLDDMAGLKAEAWPHQRTLAEKPGYRGAASRSGFTI
jgi:hypothetical protein